MRMPHSAGAFVLVSSFLAGAFLTPGSTGIGAVAGWPLNRDTARAIETYRQGNFPVAVNRFRDIVEKRPDDADAWCLSWAGVQQPEIDAEFTAGI